MPQKVCRRCGEAKDPSLFYPYKKKDGSLGLMAKCKTCHLTIAAAWNARNPERVRENNRKRNRRLGRVGICRKYGLDEVQVLAMETASAGLCAICREYGGDELFVDHDHETGEVRGLLCRSCNTAIGLMKDDPRRMLRAIMYVRRGGIWKVEA